MTRNTLNKKHGAGFTLIELMIVVVIVSILAALAFPAYNKQVRKTRRTEAKAATMTAAQNQERWFTKHFSYAPDLSTLGYSANTIDSPDDGWYSVTISATTTSGTTVTGFTVTATAQGDQLKDTDCRTFSLDEQGNKTATNSGGADTSDECW